MKKTLIIAVGVVAVGLPAVFLGIEYWRQTVPYGRGINVRYGYFSRVSPEILAESEIFLAEHAGLSVGKPKEVGRRKAGQYCIYYFKYREDYGDISLKVCSQPLRVIGFNSRAALDKGRLETYPQFRPDAQPSQDEVFGAARSILEYLGFPDEPSLYRISIRNAGNTYQDCPEEGINCGWLVESLASDPRDEVPALFPHLKIVLSFYSLNLIYLECNEDYFRQSHAPMEETP